MSVRKDDDRASGLQRASLGLADDLADLLHPPERAFVAGHDQIRVVQGHRSHAVAAGPAAAVRAQQGGSEAPSGRPRAGAGGSQQEICVHGIDHGRLERGHRPLLARRPGPEILAHEIPSA